VALLIDVYNGQFSQSSNLSISSIIRGRISYVPQQAWMQNATLKNNITFGKKFRQDLYDKVSIYRVAR
jgi:ABC-type multidrug transport system fused ATPase/permease subunit